MVQLAPVHKEVKSTSPVRCEVEFIVFALYNNHLVAYKVETTSDLRVFHLKLQSKSSHLKDAFHDQLTFEKSEGCWQPNNDFEKELMKLIDEWISNHSNKLGTKRNRK